jgi:hypothetical protein
MTQALRFDRNVFTIGVRDATCCHLVRLYKRRPAESITLDQRISNYNSVVTEPVDDVDLARYDEAEVCCRSPFDEQLVSSYKLPVITDIRDLYQLVFAKACKMRVVS